MIESLYPEYQKWAEKGSVYIYSDPHFADKDCKLMDTNWPEPDKQVELINKCVSKNDTLIILGDIGDVSYVKKLKAGYKVLIMGNHDAGKSLYERKTREYEYEFPTAIDARKALKAGVISSFLFHPDKFSGAYTGFVDNNLFDEVYEGPLMIAEKLILSHEPISLVASITGEPVAFNIHGHDHSGELARDDYHLNVAANVIGYCPVNLGKIIKSGVISDKNIKSVHRAIIDNATNRKKNISDFDETKIWKKQRDEFGFDERETWDLKFNAASWLYSHLKMFMNLSENAVSLTDSYFIVPILDKNNPDVKKLEEHTLKECLTYIISYLEIYLKKPEDASLQTEINCIKYVQCAFHIFAEVFPEMWW